MLAFLKTRERLHPAASRSPVTPLNPHAYFHSHVHTSDHYTAWRQAQDLTAAHLSTAAAGGAGKQAAAAPPPDAPFSFCAFPFLLTARAKSGLLAMEARFQMEQVGAMRGVTAV